MIRIPHPAIPIIKSANKRTLNRAGLFSAW
jgi:hypothetical protein